MGVGGQRRTHAPLPSGNRPGIHCTGGGVGLEVRLVGGQNISSPHWDSIPGPSSLQQVAIPTEIFRPSVL